MQTLVVLKPGWEKYRGLLHSVTRGLSIVRTVEIKMPIEFWNVFYREHNQKEYWPEMSKYLTSGPSLFIVLEGKCLKGCIINKARGLALEVRKKYDKTSKDSDNIVHASTSDDDATRETILLEVFSPTPTMGCKT